MLKKIFFLLFALMLIGKGLQAQVMQAKQQWITIVSENLRCWECKDKLDRYMIKENNANYEKGMLKWTYNLIKGEIKILYLPDRITADDIRTIINNAGFDADTTKADSLTYKNLIPICKRAADGGGPKKGQPCNVEPQ